MDEDKVKKISKMLELGGTMLAQHCDKCGAPLFRYKGRTLCPVCEDETKESVGETKLKNSDLWSATISLRQKLLELSEELEQEKDPRRMLELLEVMKRIIEVIGLLNSQR